MHAPKTEHHEGHETREIPIFPELSTYLQDAFEAAEDGEELVLPRMQGLTDSAFRKPLLAAIKAAGAKPWSKLFTALRATRDTELREIYPSQVVDAWIGHNETVAKKNYLQVTDEHFQNAARNPAQYGAAPACIEWQAVKAHPQKECSLCVALIMQQF